MATKNGIRHITKAELRKLAAKGPRFAVEDDGVVIEVTPEQRAMLGFFRGLDQEDKDELLDVMRNHTDNEAFMARLEAFGERVKAKRAA